MGTYGKKVADLTDEEYKDVREKVFKVVSFAEPEEIK